MKHGITFNVAKVSGGGYSVSCLNKHKERVCTAHGNSINAAFESCVEEWKQHKAKTENAEATNQILQQRVRDLESRLEDESASRGSTTTISDTQSSSDLNADNLTRLSSDEG